VGPQAGIVSRGRRWSPHITTVRRCSNPGGLRGREPSLCAPQPPLPAARRIRGRATSTAFGVPRWWIGFGPAAR